IEVEYEYLFYLPTELYYQYKNGIVPDLSKCKAYRHSSVLLSTDDLIALQKKIDKLIDEILSKERAFYSGIISDHKRGVSQICINYNYLPELKRNVHLYTLLKFKPKMKSLQEKWDKENTALGML